MKTISDKTLTILTVNEGDETSATSAADLPDDIGRLDLFLDDFLGGAVREHDQSEGLADERAALMRKLIEDQGLTDLRTVASDSEQAETLVGEMLHGLRPGSTVGSCEVGALVASGGCGHVYRGKHKQLGIDIAVKILDVGRAAQNKALSQRFLQEARTLAKLRHQHVVRIYDVGEYDGLYYLVMDFVEGRDLAQYVGENGRMNTADAIRMMRQTASALSAVHKAGIIHRDIKPSNIMLDKDGDALLMDFGLAKQAPCDEDDGQAGMTMQGMLMGTPQFVAPEQIDNAAAVTPATDVYSLGLTFYQLVTGELPITGSGLLELLDKQKGYVPPAPAEVCSDVPVAISDMIMKMIRKDPAQRFQNLDEIVACLEEPAASVAVKETSNKPGWLLAVVALAVLAVVAGAVVSQSNGPAGAQPASGGVAGDWHSRPRVFTVLPFEGAGAQDPSLAAVSAVLSKGYRVVEREQIEKILQEVTLSKEGLSSAETSIRIGKITGAQVVVTGRKSTAGFQARAYDVETSEILAMVEMTPENLDAQFSALIDQVCRMLSFKTKIESVDGDALSLEHGTAHGAVVGMRIRVLDKDGGAIGVGSIVSAAKDRAEAKLDSSKTAAASGMRVESVSE